jgi:hypothetical protein
MSDPGDIIEVEVAYALARRQHVVPVALPAGATVADALRAVAARPPFDQLDLDIVPVGIFGDRVNRDRRLEQRDRVEIYRSLAVDPRQARRQRAKAQQQGGD